MKTDEVSIKNDKSGSNLLLGIWIIPKSEYINIIKWV